MNRSVRAKKEQKKSKTRTKRVHDDHGLLGDAGVGVHLLQHLVDVGRVAVGVGLALAALLVVTALGLRRGLASLAGCLSSCLCLPRCVRKNQSAPKTNAQRPSERRARQSCHTRTLTILLVCSLEPGRAAPRYFFANRNRLFFAAQTTGRAEAWGAKL
jgi:hypothetical protein